MVFSEPVNSDKADVSTQRYTGFLSFFYKRLTVGEEMELLPTEYQKAPLVAKDAVLQKCGETNKERCRCLLHTDSWGITED